MSKLIRFSRAAVVVSLQIWKTMTSSTTYDDFHDEKDLNKR